MSDVIIEIRGGNVVGVYGQSEKTRVTIVDWDNWQAGNLSPSAYTLNCLPTSSMPEETTIVITSGKTSL